MEFLQTHPHRRFNPLAGGWVLVSPHRARRPWQGQTEPPAVPAERAYDPACYLCPGNPRAGGERNPDYPGAFVFDNDFPSLLPDPPPFGCSEAGLLVAEAEPGRCRVVCYSPRHDLTLARMAAPAVERVVDIWAEQYADLGGRPEIASVMIFENRGAMMGASNPHPHGQIWANAHQPNEVALEGGRQADYRSRHAGCLLCAYLRLELERGERLVCANDAFVALVPFWAVWPFEVLVLGRRHCASLDQLDAAERAALADILRRAAIRYDNLFQAPFPYSMGFHQRPTDGGAYPEWHFHGHFLPPLLRSAAVRKFLVGYELLGGPQRDLTAETAAERLRACAERHYLELAHGA